LKENEMPRTANGQKLRYSLHDTEKDSLKNSNFCPPYSTVSIYAKPDFGALFSNSKSQIPSSQ
jgi:hypothetical protein